MFHVILYTAINRTRCDENEKNNLFENRTGERLTINPPPKMVVQLYETFLCKNILQPLCKSRNGYQITALLSKANGAIMRETLLVKILTGR